MLVLKGLALMLTQSRKKEVDEFPIIFSYLIQQIWSCYSMSVLFSPHTMKKYKITAQTSIKTSHVLELGSAWNLAAEQFPELTVKKSFFLDWMFVFSPLFGRFLSDFFNNLESSLYSRVNLCLCLFTLQNCSSIPVQCSFDAELPKDIPDPF